MEFVLSIGLGGWALLVVGALVFGVAAHLFGEPRFAYEWLIDAIGAFAGALVASEFIVAWRTIEPVWDGVALLPALLGGVVVGLVVAIVTRLVTGGTYLERPMSA
jgi:hypothetical protein